MSPRWREGLKALGASLGALTADERRMLCLVLALALLGLAVRAWHHAGPAAAAPPRKAASGPR